MEGRRRSASGCMILGGYLISKYAKCKGNKTFWYVCAVFEGALRCESVFLKINEVGWGECTYFFTIFVCLNVIVCYHYES